MSTFRTAAQRRAEAEAAAPSSTAKIAWPDTESGPFHFTQPGAGQLGLFGANLRGRTGPYEAVLTLVEPLLEPEEFKLFKDWIARGDLDLQDFMIGEPSDEVEGGLIGLLSSEATGRPTVPSSDSSTPPVPTGISSTGEVPSTVSTPSPSPSTDSSTSSTPGSTNS